VTDREAEPMTPNEARAELTARLIRFVDSYVQIARAEVIEQVLADPELVLAALGAKPVTRLSICNCYPNGNAAGAMVGEPVLGGLYRVEPNP